MDISFLKKVALDYYALVKPSMKNRKGDLT